MRHYYFSLDFDRNRTEPVTLEEYSLFRSNPGLFIIRLENYIDELKDTLPKGTKINWLWFLVALAAGLLCFFTGRFYLSGEKYGSYLVILGAILTLLAIVTPIRAIIMGPMETNLQFKMKKQIIFAYFDFHKPFVLKSENYDQYLSLLRSSAMG